MTERENTYVALLRGVNVGGNTIVPMAKLKSCFVTLGYRNVRTYINSGNVIFTSTLYDQRSMEARIEAAITSTFTHTVRVLVYNASQIDDIVRVLPEAWKHDDSLKRNVIFLHHSIDSPQILENLHPKPGVEEIVYYPGVLLWSAKTADLSKSNLAKLHGSPLYKAMTVRNVTSLIAIHNLAK